MTTWGGMNSSENFRLRFAALLLAMRSACVQDIGCVEGTLLRQLAWSVARSTGVDIDDKRIRTARTAGAGAHRADARQLPFADEAFDFAVGQYTAHHVFDSALASAEALRVARVGVMLLDVWYDDAMPAQRTAIQLGSRVLS